MRECQKSGGGKPPRVFDTPSSPDAVFFEWFFDPCCLLACEIRKSPKSGVRNPGAIFSDRRLLFFYRIICRTNYLPNLSGAILIIHWHEKLNQCKEMPRYGGPQDLKKDAPQNLRRTSRRTSAEPPFLWNAVNRVGEKFWHKNSSNNWCENVCHANYLSNPAGAPQNLRRTSRRTSCRTSLQNLICL